MKTILCIDDDSSGLAIRKLMLEADGYTICIADCGEVGLVLLDCKNIDGVILDYQMPEMDGVEVARRIRDAWPQIPLVMLSGQVGDIPESAVHLVDAFISKGDCPERLLQVMRSRLQAGAVEPSHVESLRLSSTTCQHSVCRLTEGKGWSLHLSNPEPAAGVELGTRKNSLLGFACG